MLSLLRSRAARTLFIGAAVIMTAGTVAIAAFAFGPNAINTKVGDSVTGRSNDGPAPTVTFKYEFAGAKSIVPWRAFTRSFDEAGACDYFYSFHPYKTGDMLVRP